MASIITRALPRAARAQSRKYATSAHPEGYIPSGAEWLAQRDAIKHHAESTTNLWRKISLFVCIPGTLIMTAWVKKVEDEHHAHQEHIKHEHGGELPVQPDYPWLNKRQKAFPWGMNSLFYNPAANKNLESE